MTKKSKETVFCPHDNVKKRECLGIQQSTHVFYCVDCGIIQYESNPNVSEEVAWTAYYARFAKDPCMTFGTVQEPIISEQSERDRKMNETLAWVEYNNKAKQIAENVNKKIEFYSLPVARAIVLMAQSLQEMHDNGQIRYRFTDEDIQNYIILLVIGRNASFNIHTGNNCDTASLIYDVGEVFFRRRTNEEEFKAVTEVQERMMMIKRSKNT